MPINDLSDAVFHIIRVTITLHYVTRPASAARSFPAVASLMRSTGLPRVRFPGHVEHVVLAPGSCFGL